MNKKLVAKGILFLFIISSFFTGCQSTSLIDEIEKINETHNRSYIDIKDKKYLMVNPITIDSEIIEEDDRNLKISISYPVISGLLNLEVQEKINETFYNISKENLMPEIEGNIVGRLYHDGYYHISANYNNVLCVHYRYTTYRKNYSWWHQKNVTVVIDLNTGDVLTLEDLFQPHVDYIDIISNYIIRELIKSNYSYEELIRPFNRIQPHQPFYFDENNLVIEFPMGNIYFYEGRNMIFNIPFHYFGNQLVIFDRYLSDESLFEEKDIDKILIQSPLDIIQKIDFKNHEMYFMEIRYSLLDGLSNIEIQNKINSLIEKKVQEHIQDEAFTTEAKKNTNVRSNGLSYKFISVYIHGVFQDSISVSIQVHQQLAMNREGFTLSEGYNYNLITREEISLEELFIKDFDYLSYINQYVIEKINEHYLQWYPSLSSFAGFVEDPSFSINREGISVSLVDHDNLTDLGTIGFLIPFKFFGYDNIKLFK